MEGREGQKREGEERREGGGEEEHIHIQQALKNSVHVHVNET